MGKGQGGGGEGRHSQVKGREGAGGGSRHVCVQWELGQNPIQAGGTGSSMGRHKQRKELNGIRKGHKIKI